MLIPADFEAFRDPTFSLFQSAIHSTLLKHAAQGKTALPTGHHGLGVTADHPYMVASRYVISHFQKTHSFDAPATALASAGSTLGVSGPTAHVVSAATPPSTAAGVAGTVLDCAKLAAEIAWDEVFDRAKVPVLKNELEKAICDPFWAECLVEYEKFLASDKPQPYVVYSNIGQYVLENCFPDTATIAVIGDWGTGMGDAFVLLQQIAANFKPDILMHLGDIYYSGLPSEDSANFTNVINQVWPSLGSNSKPPLVFTLDGNHDRYAGIYGGYYQMIATLNQSVHLPQPNSYFALRNNFWQFVAMDTGYHDTSPFTVNTNLTYLEQSEIDWHLDKIKNNGQGVDTHVNPNGVRGTVLLSHHQLMSFAGLGENEQGQLAVNPNLANPFSPVFNLIDFWLWGHEHDLCVFDSYSMGPGQPLPAGRCIGASAVPIFLNDPPATGNLILPPGESEPPKVIAGTSVGNNKTVFNHSYAIIKLNDAALSINYYQIDSTDATPGNPPALTPLPYSDQVAATRAVVTARAASGTP